MPRHKSVLKIVGVALLASLVPPAIVHTSGLQQRAGTRQPAAKPAPTERRVPFAVGERLLYDVSWSNYLTAGTLALSVDAKQPSYGSTAYYITAEAKTTGMVSSLYTLYYKADTLIDAYSLLPHRGSLYSREGRRERVKITTFDHGKRQGKFEMKTASVMVKDLTLPPLTQDMLSAIYVLRSIQPRPGDRLDIPVSDSGRLYRITFVVGGEEQVKKADGTLVRAFGVMPQAIEESGKKVGSGVRFWLSNDAKLAPVRMEAALTVGRVVLALR
ncbi:MAG TPA: DUF3108 domain-containing protein [Vicinamibacterales bacterium]|nr:DUF3108 domain-containing protein [Vicinamibacterales bacterium]